MLYHFSYALMAKALLVNSCWNPIIPSYKDYL